jgi:hypothetical protein
MGTKKMGCKKTKKLKKNLCNLSKIRVICGSKSVGKKSGKRGCCVGQVCV